MTCPVCKSSTGFYRWPAIDPQEPDVYLPHPLYQRGYVVDPQPGIITIKVADAPDIPPCCERCYNKAEEKEA